MDKVKKISIIGGGGTGKTTLADNLSNVLNIPVYHIDGIHYLDNWKVRDRQERDNIILKYVDEDKWIIDGTYSSTLKIRLEKSDLIIYLDYSSLAQIKGILTRFIKHHGEEKKEILGCPERISWSFFWQVLSFRKRKRKDIIKLIKEIDSKKVLIFKNRSSLNKWYKLKFQQKVIAK